MKTKMKTKIKETLINICLVVVCFIFAFVMSFGCTMGPTILYMEYHNSYYLWLYLITIPLPAAISVLSYVPRDITKTISIDGKIYWYKICRNWDSTGSFCSDWVEFHSSFEQKRRRRFWFFGEYIQCKIYKLDFELSFEEAEKWYGIPKDTTIHYLDL